MSEGVPVQLNKIMVGHPAMDQRDLTLDLSSSFMPLPYMSQAAMACGEFLAPVNNENPMARDRKTLRENPGPPGGGLRKGLTTLSHKKHIGYRNMCPTCDIGHEKDL